MKYIHNKAFEILERLIGNGTTKSLLYYIREVCSDWSAEPNLTPYLIHSNISNIVEQNNIEFGVTKQDWAEAIRDFMEFLRYAGLVPEYLGEEDDEAMSDVFEEYISEYIRNFNVPEDKDCSSELIVHMAYYLLGVDDSYNSSLIEHFTPLVELNSTSREKDSYKKLLDEYDAQQLDVKDDNIMKSIEPVDVSTLPEYVIDSLYLHKGKYYRPSDVRKMITAASQTAQALEKEDLEDELTEMGLSAEELGRKYIKKLKLRKEKKKNES